MFAVVPLRGRPGWWQVLLSYLPMVLVALLVVAAVIVAVRWVPWRHLGRRGLWLAILLVLIAGGVVAAVLLSRVPPGPPAIATTQPSRRWTTFMGDTRRTGRVGDSPSPAGKKGWVFRDTLSRAAFAASPAVLDGRIYAGCDNHKLYCLDARTGKPIWTFEAAYELFAAPVVASGRVYIGEGLHHHEDARVYCLDASTGEKVWEVKTAGHVECSPTLYDGRLYFGAGGDGLWCIDAATGKLLWKYKDVHVDMCPAVDEGGAYFGTVYGESAFYCVDRKTGTLVWRTDAPLEVCGSPSTDGQRVYFGLGNGTFSMSHANPAGAVFCLSAKDGSVVWKRSVGDVVLTTVALFDGKACFGSRDGRVYCVDAASGEAKWEFPAGEPVVSSPAVAGGRVHFGCNDGQVYCVDGATGKKVWAFDASKLAFNTEAGVMASPVLWEGRLYVGAMNFCFFCVE